MKYYLAPMEGITGYIYRNAYYKTFHNIDKYFTPFIVANKGRNLKAKELRDVLPENNLPYNVIPQILTNNAKDFISTANKLQDLGYGEVNLNLGCPSGTVVSKGKGSGFLAKKEELNIFLEEIFKLDNINISIKTRIGKDEPEEFYQLLQIFNQYPIHELTIHPRTQRDYYNNKPNMNIFTEATKVSINPICYNGDIFNVHDCINIKNSFTNIKAIMLGRGIISNPGLVNEILTGTKIDNKTIKIFHDEIFNGYIELLKDDRNVLFKMKEIWAYMIKSFNDDKKAFKKIKKAQKIIEYKQTISEILI